MIFLVHLGGIVKHPVIRDADMGHPVETRIFYSRTSKERRATTDLQTRQIFHFDKIF